MDSKVVREIEDILQNKLGKEEPKNVFRDVFCRVLGFKYDNSKILVDISDDLVDGDLISIGKTVPKLGESYHIIYGEMGKITKTARRNLVKKLVDYFSYEEEGSFILILYGKNRNVWEIITYARLLGRIQLRIFRVGPGESHRTTSENLAKLKLENADVGRSELAIIVEEAFNVLPVTKEFFDDYKRVIGHLVDYIRQTYRSDLEVVAPAGVNPQLFIYRSSKSFSHTLLNRLMFIMFLQKKGWIGGRKDFLKWLYQEVYEEESYEFYRDFLRPLFLDILNKPSREKKELVDGLNIPDSLKAIYKSIHYYNGGLFSPLREFGVNLDEIITEFKGDNGREIVGEIMEFLHKYNFTVSEESPFEVEVAVDPAMLGYIYESLIAEQERGSAGIFYTPKEEVDFMCRMALYNYLTKFTDEDTVIKLLFSEDPITVPREVIDALDKLKVVDPASGSGAFLVGMFNVIREIYEKARVPVDFERKKKIIREVLHGVDVKEWAVRVAELRLWLALIEDEEEMPNYEPLLPNLTPNLRVGDSLVSEGVTVGNFTVGGIKIDGMPVSIGFSRDILNSLSGKRREIVDLKHDVFNGEMNVVDYERARIRLFVEAVTERIQTNLFGSATAKSSDIEKLKKSYESNRNLQIPFFWEFDFADVMDDGGFDIVIANPPYVRQESIYPEFFDPDELEMLPVDKTMLKNAYKQAIIKNTEKIVDSEIKKRSDIYAYFFMKGINILKNGGTLVFITSNSWLDVDYGTKMQEEFLKKTHLKFVFDYPHRSFKEADVNTIITMMEKKGETLLDPESKVKFTKLKKKIGELQYEDFEEILTLYSGGRDVNLFGATVKSIDANAARYRVVDEVNLAKLGGASPARVERKGDKFIIPNYNGAKWGGLLIRAPEIFYTIMRKGEGKLVRLGDIADVKRGFTTGANEFFYLQPIENPEDWPECEICGRNHSPGEGLVAVKNGAGWEGYIEEEFLRPVVKSPQEIKTYRIRLEDLKYKVFLCNLSKEELRRQNKRHALKYIEWGEERGYHRRPTCRARERWWDLGNRPIGNLACMMSYNYRFPFWVNNIALCDARLYDVYIPFEPNDLESENFIRFVSYIYGGVLNWSFVPLMMELTGRSNLGEGALDFKVYETENLLVVDINTLSQEDINRIFTLFQNDIANREIKPIFEEFGLPRPDHDFSNINPEDVTLEGVMPDRRELDRIIFEALGLTEEEQLEVYKAVVGLVKERLVKARSFGR